MNELASAIDSNVSGALHEDIGIGDWTAQLIAEDASATAKVISRSDATICGAPWFDACFRALDPSVVLEWQFKEGARVTANQTLVTIRGTARALLTGERTALNFLQLLSAVSTATRRYVDA